MYFNIYYFAIIISTFKHLLLFSTYYFGFIYLTFIWLYFVYNQTIFVYYLLDIR